MQTPQSGPVQPAAQSQRPLTAGVAAVAWKMGRMVRKGSCQCRWHGFQTYCAPARHVRLRPETDKRETEQLAFLAGHSKAPFQGSCADAVVAAAASATRRRAVVEGAKRRAIVCFGRVVGRAVACGRVWVSALISQGSIGLGRLLIDRSTDRPGQSMERPADASGSLPSLPSVTAAGWGRPCFGALGTSRRSSRPRASNHPASIQRPGRRPPARPRAAPRHSIEPTHLPYGMAKQQATAAAQGEK